MKDSGSWSGLRKLERNSSGTVNRSRHLHERGHGHGSKARIAQRLAVADFEIVHHPINFEGMNPSMALQSPLSAAISNLDSSSLTI